jgi:predicted  nucleic acid-binding Zn-ribbon protein
MPATVEPFRKVSYNHEQPAMGATEPDSVPVVDSVVRAIHNLTTDANYKLVSDVFSEAMFLKDQNRSLKTAKRELLEEYRSFRNELEEERKKLKDESDLIRNKIEEKERRILELDGTNTQLTEAKDLLEAQLREKDEALVAVTTAKTGLEQDKTTLEALIGDKDARLIQLIESNSILGKEKAALESEVKEKTKELAALTNERDAIATSLSDEAKKLEAVTEEKVGLESELAALVAAAVEKDAELDRLRGEKAALIQDKDTLESKVLEQEQDINDLSGLKTKIESDLAEVKSSKSAVESELAGATAKIEEQNRDIEVKTEDIAVLRTDIDERTKELTSMKVELDKVTTAAEEHKAQRDSLTKELTDMTTNVADKNAHIEALSSKIDGLTQEVEMAHSSAQSLQGQLEVTTKTAEERAVAIQTLETELTAMTSTANDAKTRVEFLETELSIVSSKAAQLHADLATVSDDLRLKNIRLAELDSYRVSLRSESEDTYVQILDTIWTSIAGLVETQFRQDLDPSVLSDNSCWVNLRQSEYLKDARHIPLPQSNSPAAKQMRVAAVLAVLSRSLHRYIFRPVYLADDSSGDDCIVGLLRAIARDSPTREEHARATLLAMLPDKQKAAAAKRVSAVVREVSWSVQHLLSALQYEDFCTGLETACKLACVQWLRIQMARMKIEPYFGPPYDNWDWQVLPLPAFGASGHGVHLHGDGEEHEGGAIVDDTDDVVVEIGRPVGDVALVPEKDGRVTGQEDQRSLTSSPRSAMDQEADTQVGPDEIMLVVWPSMCAIENEELESITQGLVISKEQVRTALDEVRGRGRQRPTRARTLSMPGRGVSGSLGQSVLPQQGGGDGPKDG